MLISISPIKSYRPKRFPFYLFVFLIKTIETRKKLKPEPRIADQLNWPNNNTSLRYIITLYANLFQFYGFNFQHRRFEIVLVLR